MASVVASHYVHRSVLMATFMRRFDLKNKLYCIPINLFDAVALLHTEQKVQKCPRSFGGTKSFI